MQQNGNSMPGFWANNMGSGAPGPLSQVAQLQQQQQGEAERKKKQGLMLLAALAAASGKGKEGVDSGPSTVDSGKTHPRPLGGGEGVGGGQGAVAKTDPMSLMGAAGASANAAGAAGTGAKFLGALGSPGGMAALAAGTQLAGGLLGDDGAEEMAKRQMRQQGQQHLFEQIRGLGDRMALRNQEMRGYLGSLGR